MVGFCGFDDCGLLGGLVVLWWFVVFYVLDVEEDVV